MDDNLPTAKSLTVVTLAEELGVISTPQARLAEARHQALRRGGIKLSLGQTLLERRFVTPLQIRGLMQEFAARTASLAPPRNPLAANGKRMFGQYELLEILSEKTGSRIIRARDTLMDRPVVLKILPNSMKSDAQWAERFRRETMLLGKMAHPNLVQAYAASEIEGHAVIAMEYVEGPSVGDRIESEGYLPEKEAWLIAREIAKALAYAARAGILHRDIKPDNIVCSKGGRVKLIDMGLSKSLADTTHLTVEGTTVGTPFYISPEQAGGTRSLDARTDIYSLGCSVYHMLAGVPPFWGDEITEVMLKHVEAKRPDPREIIPEISAGSAALVMRMMAVQPEKRPPSADAVGEEIAALLPTLPKLFGQAAAAPIAIAAPRSNDVLRIPAKSASAPKQFDDSSEKSARPMPQAPDSAPRERRGVKTGGAGIWRRMKSWVGM